MREQFSPQSEKGAETNNEEPKQYSRREFLKKFAKLSAAYAVGFASHKYLSDPSEKPDNDPDQETKEEMKHEASELFRAHLSGYKEQYGALKRDEALFVDDLGRPIRAPIPYSESIRGITAGELDDQDFLVADTINQPWIDAWREEICSQRPEVTCDIEKELPNLLVISRPIREEVQNNSEDINPETFMDIVMHYGSKETIGGGGLSRIDYIQKHAMSNADIPETIKAELTRILPGLAAQESRFNNASTSIVGAEGIFQFMPNTWKGLGYSENDILYLKNQVEAVGKYFNNAYRYITNKAESGLLTIKEEYFAGDENAFMKDFLTPILVNSYNVGYGDIAQLVNWFAEEFPSREEFEQQFGPYKKSMGHDVFSVFKNAARFEGPEPNYGKHSSEYTLRVYALSELIQQESEK